MSKRKAKAKPQVNSPQEQYKAFIVRLKSACDLMAGEGIFEKLPQRHLPQLFDQRFPPLKLEFAKGDFTAEEEAGLQQKFRLRMSDLSIATLTGKQILLTDYFRDGILLANYIGVLCVQNPEWAWLKPISEAYDVGSETIFMKAAFPVINFINSLCILYSDRQNKRLMVGDYATCVIMRPAVIDNKIRLSYQRLPLSTVRLDGSNREIVPLCWTNYLGKLEQSMAVPANVGFSPELTQPVPVYFQHHALARLSERLSLTGGMLFFFLSRLFDDELSHLTFNNTHLLSVYLFDKKLGYLVIDFAEGKLIIRTFLFITNDGVPEGKKLWELTKLRKLDKQFLGIDTLAGIGRLSIADHPALKELFTEAGCTDLLDLSDVNYFMEMGAATKDPDMLLKFLQDSPFMQRRTK